MKFFTNEVKIAIVAIVGIVLLFFGMNFLKGISVFSNDSTYYIQFDDISGLSASNPIYANGYQVGVVKNIDYDYSGKKGVIVKFDVDNKLKISEGTSAEIVTDLMGNVNMNLLLNSNSNVYLSPGDTLSGHINEGMKETIAKLMPVMEKMLPKIDSIVSNLNALMADPALPQSLHNMQTLTSDLTVTTANINSLVAQLNTDVPRMLNKTDYALDKIGETFDNTSKVSSNLAAIDVSGTMSKVDQTLTNVQNFTNRLERADGTLGLLINDPSLYYKLNSAIVSADSLMTNLKAHPRRYVHFSLFGRKCE
ncbi:MAG: MlaD family protein [Prevotella sp.]|jgi:phospholipid/cholesterol/gamma-HCH transport system substrate-binding protein